MTIRGYKNSDFEKLVKIYDLAKPDEFSGENAKFKIIPLKNDDQMLKLFKDSNLYVYEEKTILGFAGHKGNYISWLFVHPEHRGLKIGQLLIKHILTKLKGNVGLNVADSNLAAKKLYISLGFIIEKQFEGKYQDTPIKVNRMEIII